MKTVYVGLSGGVDSSVAAALLKEQGYKVVGAYMKNWTKDLPGMPCPWKEDFQDAKRVAVQLGIDFKVFDFEKQYKDKVVEYMLDGFKAGFTPNPDIMCNQEIKFKLFLHAATSEGADYIATGHYAKTNPLGSGGRLFMAKDKNKDQTYFLHRVRSQALAKTIFPLGDLTKPQVREIAKKHGLVTADKKESMGICFVGKIGIKEFLSQYVEKKPGNIIDQTGKTIGQHDGAIFYTIGQRRGLEVGGGLPYYVTGKNMKKNEVHVTTHLDDKKLWSSQAKLTSLHWINSPPKLFNKKVLQGKPSAVQRTDQKLLVRTRHRAKLVAVKSFKNNVFELSEEVRALTPGQSAVFYAGNECLGGGIVV